MGTLLPGFPFWASSSDALPLGASLTVLAALGVAVMRRKQGVFRRRAAQSRLSDMNRPVTEEGPAPSGPLPLLVGTYRKRAVQMTLQSAGTLFVSVALARYGELEVASDAGTTSLPWGQLSCGRLERLPSPWQVTVRGRQLWLAVPDDGRDPLAMRRRLEFACDLADEWDALGKPSPQIG